MGSSEILQPDVHFRWECIVMPARLCSPPSILAYGIGTTNFECPVTGTSTTHDGIEIETFECFFFSCRENAQMQ
jgi:hypothetical protein